MKLANKTPIIALSIIGFLLSVQLGFTTYIDSSYLASLLSNFTSTPDDIVGYIFALSSLFSLLGMLYLPKILRKFGGGKIILVSSILLPIFLFILYIKPNISIGVFSYLLTILSYNMIFTISDILLSSYVDDKDMGFVRGIYFALMSLGFMLSPAISGFLVESKGMEYAYLAGAIFTIPLSLISYIFFRKYKDEAYEDVPLLPNKELRKTSSDLMPIFWAHFAVQAFYSVMTVYVPLYFIEHIGLSFDKFGYILTIALANFVILPSIIGYFADKYIGEKEMIIVGILLMGLSLIFIPILARHPQSIIVWGIVLFISRIGASMTESMTDVFFFKKIEHSHPSLVAFYRRARPLAVLTVPIFCSLLLSTNIVDLSELFIICGISIIAIIIFPLKLVDTK